jgi:transcriptional regulator with XRE-family HTH domain
MNRANKDSENNLNLETIRQILGMTQEEFANAIGISSRSVGRYENGIREPVFTIAQMKRFIKLLEKAEIDFRELPDTLMGGKARTEEKELVAA